MLTRTQRIVYVLIGLNDSYYCIDTFRVLHMHRFLGYLICKQQTFELTDLFVFCWVQRCTHSMTGIDRVLTTST